MQSQKIWKVIYGSVQGEGRISRFDGKSFTTFTTRQGLSSDFIISAITDQNGKIWFGTDGGGLIRFDGDTITVFKSDNKPGLNQIVSLNEDNSGNIWFGTRQDGMVKYVRNTFLVFNENHGLLNEYIPSIAHDRHGNLWIGTYGAGLGLYQGQRFTHYSENQGLPDSFIRSLFQDPSERIWLGSNRSGPFVYQNGLFSNFARNNFLQNLSIRTIAADSKGNIWFGTNGSGVLIYDGEKFLQFTSAQGLSGDNITSLYNDIDGRMWIGTVDAGITLYDGVNFSYLNKKSGLSDISIRKIIQDKNGDILIATRNGGITRIDGSSISWYNEETGLGCNQIFDIMVDSEGILWVGTDGKGLIRFDGNTFTHFTEKEGLVNNFVYSVLEDKDQNIWAGTRNGLSRLLKSNYDKLIKVDPNEQGSPEQIPVILFKNYSQDNGYLGIGTNSRSMLETTDGTIWIGANDILSAFNPAGDLSDTIPPIVEIIRVGLYNENISWNYLENNPDTQAILANGVKIGKFSFDSLSRWFGVPHGLILSYYNNYITFQFTGITSNFARNLHYRFKLEGLDELWSSLTSRTEVSYGNLSPGKYTFKVQAVNSEGYWSDETHYHFEINYPWWQMWWAYVAYGVAGLLVIIVVFTIRSRISGENEKRKEKELILRQELIIAKQSAEFKQNFLANMSHEIRTPLTGILGMAEILERTELSEDQRDYLNTLIMSGENLRETINMVLDYSKIEAGKLQLNEEPFVFQELFDDAEKLFTGLNKNGLAMQLFIDPDIPENIVADQRRVAQVLGNLLSNAVKFTEKGKITVKASLSNDRASGQDTSERTILIEVRDTGKGISNDDQANLFKPFFQVEQAYNRSFDGTGLGLAICKELVTLMGGKIGVESQAGKGSNFWFTFSYHLAVAR
jgi:two-component system, sensor histidine kinase ChiS